MGKVKALRLSPRPDGSKQGIDDVIAQEGPEGVARLVASTRSATAQTVMQRVRAFLTQFYDVRHNTLMGCAEIARKGTGNFAEVTERRLADILIGMDEFGIPSGERALRILLQSQSCAIDFNPVEDYFRGLPPNRQRKPSIARLFSLLNADADLMPLFRRWMLGAVACGCSGIPNHLFLILVGAQGVGKTTFLSKLCPLPEYLYVGPANVNDKDSRIRLGRYFIVNFDELGSTPYRELQQVKSMVTQEYVNERRAYGKRDERIRRHASFCGSLNQTDFLKDDTGNRRFAVISVGKIDTSRMTRELINDAWAEAYASVMDGEQTWPTAQEEVLIAKVNETFRSRSLEEHLVRETFMPGSRADHTFSGPATDVARLLSERWPEHREKMSIERIGRALNSIGAQPSSVRRPGSSTPRRLYFLKELFDEKGGQNEKNE